MIRRSPLPRRTKPVRKTNPKRRQSEFSRCFHSRERVRWVKSQPCAGTHRAIEGHRMTPKFEEYMTKFRDRPRSITEYIAGNAMSDDPKTDAVPVMTSAHAEILTDWLPDAEDDAERADDYRLTDEVYQVVYALASGALRTYNPQTHVVVPREAASIARQLAAETVDDYTAMRCEPRPIEAEFITRWLTDGNEEAR